MASLMSTSEVDNLSMATTSTLSKQISGARILTNMSPLSDRHQLRPTMAMETLASDLEATGMYDVGWNGALQVSPRPMHFRNTQAAYDSFVNRNTHRMRPRTQSSLTFTTKAPKGFGDARPRTAASASVDLGSIGAGGFAAYAQQQQHPASASGSGRFSRLAQSTDSLQQLKGGSGIPAANILALKQPAQQYVQQYMRDQQAQARPGTAPADSSGRLHTPAGIDQSASPSGAAAGEEGARRVPQTPSLKDQNDAAAAGFRTSLSRQGERPTTSAGGGGEYAGGDYARGSGTPVVSSQLRRSTRRQHPMSTFKPSRGHALIVFNDLDKDKNGLITRCELEAAAVALGFNLRQAQKLFERLDKGGKGYITVSDWGDRDFFKAIQHFSLMYMQKFLGLPDLTTSEEAVRKYWHTQNIRQVRSLPAAINMARINAVTRGANLASAGGNVVYDAFRFIDTDNSGALSKEELRDGFFALGVYLSEEVTEQIMTLFDKDNSGTVEYDEFLSTLFPGARGRAG